MLLWKMVCTHRWIKLTVEECPIERLRSWKQRSGKFVEASNNINILRNNNVFQSSRLVLIFRTWSISRAREKRLRFQLALSASSSLILHFCPKVWPPLINLHSFIVKHNIQSWILCFTDDEEWPFEHVSIQTWATRSYFFKKSILFFPRLIYPNQIIRSSTPNAWCFIRELKQRRRKRQRQKGID